MARRLRGIYELHSDGQVYFANGKKECWVGEAVEIDKFWFKLADLDDDYRESLAKDKQLGPIQLVKWKD